MSEEDKEIAEITIHMAIPREELKEFLMKYAKPSEQRGESKDAAPRMRSACEIMGCATADAASGVSCSGCWRIYNTDGGVELHCLYGNKEVVTYGVIKGPRRPWQIE